MLTRKSVTWVAIKFKMEQLFISDSFLCTKNLFQPVTLHSFLFPNLL